LAQSWRNIHIQTLREESGFFAAGENSAVTDTGYVLHSDGIDTTTLSPECQQPCQPNPIRVAETPKPVAQQRFSQRRRTLEEIFSTRVSRPSRLAAKDPPTLRQLCAKGPIRRSHPRTLRRRDERPVNNPPTGNRPTTARANTCLDPAGRVEPSHQSVNNPLTKVSTTLQLQVRHNVSERAHHLPAGYTRKKRTSR